MPESRQLQECYFIISTRQKSPRIQMVTTSDSRDCQIVIVYYGRKHQSRKQKQTYGSLSLEEKRWKHVKHQDHQSIPTVPWIITENRDITDRLEGQDKESIIKRIFKFRFKRVLATQYLKVHIEGRQSNGSYSSTGKPSSKSPGAFRSAHLLLAQDTASATLPGTPTK